jgi:hypothetical protein
MVTRSSVWIWLLSGLVFTSTAFAKDKPFEKSFELKVLGISIGQVIVGFEDRINPGNITLEVNASLTSPSRSILPPGVSPYSLPLINLPVFITIKTTTAFRGPARVSLHLEVLNYNPSLPLRLFAASGTSGSLFQDITAYRGPGSMYTRGYRDGFSEFIIAWDGRALTNVIDSKFDNMENYLAAHQNVIAPHRYMDLQFFLEDATLAYYLRHDVFGSMIDLEQFTDLVRVAIKANEMPCTYNDPLNPYPNVAGGLIMLAETTAFSLGLVP